MRRPRKHLEVSTFPFLAVLLCAMGSLILILMVFDRRAKLAANERNRLAAAAAFKERQEEIARLQARQAQVQEGLSQKEKDAAQKLAASRTLKKQLSEREEELRKQLAATQKKWEELDRWIKESKERLAEKTQRKDLLSQGLESEKKTANLAIEKFTQKQTELGRMSSEIIALKKILEELKTAPAKPVETYSIIPYFGKRGDSRKPIYVECQARAYVFHPGALIVPVDDLHQFRAQVNLRARVSEMRDGIANASVPAQPYLLLLVRPDGIENYWKAQAMLRGDKLDFGYELIDGEWKLEFPEDPELTKALRNLPLGGSRLAASDQGGFPGRTNSAFGQGGGGDRRADGSPRTAQGIGRLGDPSAGSGVRGGQPGASGGFSGNQPGGGALGGAPGGGGLAGMGPDSGHPGSGMPGRSGPGNGIPEFPRKPERSLGLGDLAGLLGPDVGGASGAGSGNGPIRGIPSGPDRDQGGDGARPGFIGTGVGLGSGNPSGTPNGRGNGNGGYGVAGVGPGGPGRPGGAEGQAGGQGGQGGTGDADGSGGSGNASSGSREFGRGRGPGGNGSGGSGTGGSGGSAAGGPGFAGVGAGGVGESNGGSGGAGAGSGGSGSKQGDLASGGGGASDGSAANGGSASASGAAGSQGAAGAPGGSQGGSGQAGGGGGAAGDASGEPGGGAQGLSVVLNPEAKREKPSRDAEDPDKPKKKLPYSVGAVSSRSDLDEDSDGPNPLARVAAPDPLANEAATKKEPRPLRVARLDGSRDFILFIECNAQGIVVHPEKQKFAGHELETEGGAKRLLNLMRQQVERKTKKTLAGDPPPKGQIRFLVRPEGLRWYHASFPIIEELQIKTTRQTLEPEDIVRDIILGTSR